MHGWFVCLYLFCSQFKCKVDSVEWACACRSRTIMDIVQDFIFMFNFHTQHNSCVLCTLHVGSLFPALSFLLLSGIESWNKYFDRLLNRHHRLIVHLADVVVVVVAKPARVSVCVCECHYIWFVWVFSVLSFFPFLFFLSNSFHSLCWTVTYTVFHIHMIRYDCLTSSPHATTNQTRKKINIFWNCETKSKLLKNTWKTFSHSLSFSVAYLDCALELCFYLKNATFEWSFLLLLSPAKVF